MISSSYILENDAQFRRTIKDASKKASNLKLAFALIAKDWFQSNITVFKLKGPGLYPPLSPAYAAQKAKRFPGASILVATGRLRDSISGRVGLQSKPSVDSILQIGRQSLILGTRVPYGIFHQSDAPRKSNLPQRKFLFIGPEAPSVAPSRITGRLERWLGILDAEVQRQLDKVNG